jgi:hypothetical protein
MPNTAPEPRRARRAALAVFCLVAGLLLLSSGGHTYTIDEELMFRTAAALAERGSFVLNTPEPGEPIELSKYGPAQPVLAVPLYWAGEALARLFPREASNFVTRAVVVWFNPFVTAGVAALIVVAAARLGYGLWPAAGAALIYVFGTTAWPHSKTFFAEPLTALLQFGAFLLLLRRPADPPLAVWRLLAAGLLAGVAPLVKIQAGLALPVLGLWLLWQEWLAAPGRAGLTGALRAGALWGVVAAATVLLQPIYQWAVFGDAVRSGYDSLESTFTNPLLVGLFGLIASSGKGIIWYAPPLVLFPWGLWLLWRRDVSAAVLCAAMTASHFLFYAVVVFWHGDVAWGPRYLNIVLPFMALPLAPVLAVAAAGARPARTIARAAVALSCLAAIPAQLGGTAISMNAWVSVQRDEPTRIWVIDQSPILGHLRLLGENLRQLYGMHLAPDALVLKSGFWYSEGDRTLDENTAAAQLPRWTWGRAEVAVRPPAGQPTRLTLDITSCWARPAPTSLVLSTGGQRLISETPCPGRRYELLLPPGDRSVQIDATLWDPVAAGVDRAGPLGVALVGAAARSGDTELTVRGDLLPPPPAPDGRIMLRRWFSDHRFGHWDHWAWFFAVSGYPARPLAIFAGLWLAASLGLLAAGAWLAWGLRRGRP